MGEKLSEKDQIIRLSQFESSAAAALPVLVDEARKICQQKLHTMLCHMFESADDKLFDMADSGYDRAKFDALRLLRLKKDSLLKDFSLGLDERFLQSLSKSAVQHEDSRDLSSLSFEDIALVENSELEEEIALDAMVSRVRQASADELEKIRLRFDALISDRTIGQKHNPLEPVVICEVFKQALTSLELDIETLLVIYKLFERAVCANIPRLYEQVNSFFVEKGVLPELRISTPRGYRNPNQPSRPDDFYLQESDNSRFETGGIDQSISENDLAISSSSDRTYTANATENQVVTLLRELIASKRDETASHSSSANVSSINSGGKTQTSLPVSTEQLLNVLSGIQRQMHHQPLTPSATNRDDLRNVIGQQITGQPNSEVALTPFNEDMIDIVSMLFDFILDDKSIAVEIKSLLARLQIPMLKVGMIDRQFFSNKKHSARQLLNELAYAGISWDAKDPSSPAMLQAITQIVEKICDEFVDDVSIFDKMLDEFTAFKAAHEKKAAILEKRTREAEEGKAKAESARGKVNQALNEICKGRKIPKVVKQIFKQVWAHVMFLEALKGEDDGWTSANRFARALVWSVQLKEEEAELNKLVKLVPQLVKTLKKGFDRISLSHIEAGTILDQLEFEHRRIIEESKKRLQEEEEVLRLKPESLLSPADDQDTESSLTEDDIEEEIVIEDVGFSRHQTGETEPPEDIKAKLLPESLAAVEKLHAGSWYELKIGNEFKRCKLAARIVSTGRYIFVNRSGIKVAEFLTEQLAFEYQSGQLKLLDDEALFDRALESVISNLREMKAAAQ